MAITEKEIFEMMFSGLGTGIGKDLTGTIKEFLEDPEKELTTLLKTEFPEETQQTIKKIAEGILERNDYSFIPQPKTKEQEEFSQKWEAAYKSTLEEYKKFTSDIFATLTRGSVFEQEHVTNRLEYKRQIKKITLLHPQCYSKEKKGFEERFERFEQNSPNRRTLEAMDMNMNLLYRLPKDSKACPVDAFAMRVKSPQRIAEKIARKWVMLIDKIETAKLEGKQYNARYDDLFLTDVFGFLVLQNKNKKFDDGTIYYAGNIKTIEDSDKKTEDKTKTQHRSKGQRQVKLADTTTGVIYDYHLFRTLGDWIDNEFSRKPTDTEAEKKPHEEYMKDKLRTVIKKNLSYQKVFDQITNRASTSLQNCHNEKITETTYQTYMRLEPNQKTAFLAEAQKKLEAKITELRYTRREEKRKKIGVTTIHSNLTEIVKCYNEEIRKTLNQDPETCNDQEYGQARKSVTETMDSLNILIKQYKEVTGNTYTTKEVGELLNSYLLISKICELNKEMEKRYANLKNESITNFKETETIRTIKYYKGILENFPTEYRGEETMITLTKYNIYKHLISSQKLFLDLSKTPNAYESQGVSVNNWQNMGREFNCFIKENKEKLGNKRITESNKIITEVKYY